MTSLDSKELTKTMTDTTHYTAVTNCMGRLLLDYSKITKHLPKSMEDFEHVFDACHSMVKADDKKERRKQVDHVNLYFDCLDCVSKVYQRDAVPHVSVFDLSTKYCDKILNKKAE